MPNDDHLQRQIEFIVDNQAQFTTDIQQLKELHQQAEKRMTNLEDVCLRLGNAMVNLAERGAESSARLDERMAELAKSHERLAESQEHTDQRLSALIDIVMQERNGKRPT